MKTIVRFGLVVVAAIQIIFAVAFFFQWTLATRLWPFPGTTPLTYIFIASIFAAAAVATLWTVVTKNDAALAGIAIDYVFILIPVAILAFQLGLVVFGVLCLFGVLFGLGLLAWSLRIPLDRSRPMPGLARWSFIVFVVALLFVSTRLIFRIPNTLPWTITPDLSVVIGWMFMGAAAYFVYGLVRPSWANTGGQLASFLAYDLVLIVPFLQRLPTVAPEHRVGLIIYTAVVVYSGLVAIYLLFIHPATRSWGAPPVPVAKAG